MGSASSENLITAMNETKGTAVLLDPKMDAYRAAVSQDDEDMPTPVQWMVSMLLYFVPIVNIIYLIVVILKGGSEAKNGWAKGAAVALVIYYVVGIAAFIILKNITIMQLFDIYSQIRGL